MNRLTPELFAISTFDGAAAALETRELDFNLSRRSAVVINQVRGTLLLACSGADYAYYGCQELDLDPDNVDIWGSSPTHDGFDYDSSRVFRQVTFGNVSIVVATQAWANLGNTNDRFDWTNLPMEQRPISITNMRHHCELVAAETTSYHAELYIKYFIVELTLEELGILNASRR